MHTNVVHVETHFFGTDKTMLAPNNRAVLDPSQTQSARTSALFICSFKIDSNCFQLTAPPSAPNHYNL